ncbi:hypothetical protein [Nocardia macrotermitis]|uniref:Hemophore-related protein n=1 Tax=Nocardia macrotermitis TaxID=2585198 RepID=A0A7K0D115_9NOCA|nr:hypothetical protein [Nocardia macrotermitis]MQY19410.1 hypothetical protein [Nocardia macrotermitis]
MKTALVAALAVPLFIALPVVAQADPPHIFTPQQQCEATKAVVDMERKTNPHATPQQITDGYMAFLDKKGAFKGLPQATRDRQRQFILDQIASCHLA